MTGFVDLVNLNKPIRIIRRPKPIEPYMISYIATSPEQSVLSVTDDFHPHEDTSPVDVLQRPWRLIKRHTDLETVFILSLIHI